MIMDNFGLKLHTLMVKKNDEYKEWYENGQLKIEYIYNNGKKNGM